MLGGLGGCLRMPALIRYVAPKSLPRSSKFIGTHYCAPTHKSLNEVRKQSAPSALARNPIMALAAACAALFTAPI
jgi:hypothetical protein